MSRAYLVRMFSATAVAVLVVTSRLWAVAGDTRVADAAMQDDRTGVAALVKSGADVNGAQGDGMTAILWAAEKNDLEMARLLLAAGASVNATTRIGGYSPIFLASRNGNAEMIQAFVAAGAAANTPSTTGTTPLMLAAASGSADAINVLLDSGADVNARESAYGQTALMFAAADDRVLAIRALIARGAHVGAWSRVLDMANQPSTRGGGAAGGGAGRGAGGRGARGGAPAAAAPAGAGPTPPASGGQGANAQATTATATGATPLSTSAAGTTTSAATGQSAATNATNSGAAGATGATGAAGATSGGRGGRGAQAGAAGGRGAAGAAAGGQDAQAPAGGNANGDDSRPAAIDFEGGMTPLLFAARQGHVAAVHALIEAGADVNQVCAGDKTSPLLIATINGHFDIAMYLLDHGANPNLASTANAAPLYAAINVQYAPHAFYPQPSPAQEKASLLVLMTALLEHGADPNARLAKKLWYVGYNFDQSGVDSKGSTPFWRAAQAADVEAMKLLVSYGADPSIPSDAAAGGVRQPNGRSSNGAAATAAPPRLAATIVDGVTPLQMASGAGYDGNFQVLAPGGFMPALKYLVEDLHADPTAADYRGYTPVHNAAFRGDNEMILYLVSKGADATVETKSGETAIDLANGPVQRIQPFPDTIKLLEGMGVKNNHRCVSCGGH